MQQLQDSVFSIVKTTNLSPAVFSFLQPTEESSDKTPLGGILNDTKYGWLALGPKFCVVDLRTGLKVAARSFETLYSNSRTMVTSVVELPTPLTDNSKQLIISLQCEDTTSTICVFHVNGSQILRCLQTDLVVTELAVCDSMPDGPFTCFDGVIMAGTSTGEVFVFDLDIAGLIQALKDISQGSEHLIHTESNPSNLTFLPLDALQQIEEQRDLVLANNDHLAILLNENSIMGGQYIFRNPDGTARMKAKRDHVRVTVLQYIPQLGSLAVGFNFGAFQIWNLLNLELEFTSQVNVECLPVTHFGFQEPCDDPRAFCYLWVVFSVLDRFEEEGFPLAVMYSLTYQGKRMLSDTKCLYQEFSMATVRFQVELSAIDDAGHLMGGKCVSCNAYSVNSTLGAEGEDSMLNICQLVWECWVENANNSSQYGMLLFDLDQWYKDQMPATCRLASNAFMSATWCSALSAGACLTLDVRLQPASVSPYTHATRLEEHFYPNSLQYNCICLNTSESCVLNTIGIQRQIISSMDDVGPTALLNPPRLYSACVAAGLTPMEANTYFKNPSQEEQRRYLLSVALEARLSRFLKRCAHDWATGSHAGAGCTLPFLVDWCWQRAIELKENARELTAPLFTSSALPDRNVVRCLEHCVQQLTQLTGLLDAILTKCCNLVVPDALSEMEEKHKGISCVSLYLQVVQWFLRVGLLPEHLDSRDPLPALPYPASSLPSTYTKRRMKLKRLEENSPESSKKSCSLLYIDQLIENEFGGDRIHQMWLKGGSEWNGLYPPPSLHALLRLYLLPDIADEHKHSLVLYLLVDYSVVYDDVRYEAVIRRLMQFPTMFGLSNTAIKATQAFWHLDHRDFDFALDQLQCLTGNTLSEWQHSVVLWSLLKQKKTQAALQYLHVRKPAPVTCRVNDHDKLEDWQSCCNLYLARGLVFEALDVIRMCVQNAASADDKLHLLNFFFKACRNTGQLSKILQVTLLPVEEDVFIKYLQNCNESQTSDILVMYYLQQSRYLEAEQYNNKLKQNKSSRVKESTGSAESLADLIDREGARDAIVEVVCSSLPAITNTVKDFALSEKEVEHHVFAPKPMSVFIQARSPKNTFTYKSSFIQDTIENASETWLNKPKMRKGIKRALNIEDTPFICTPKLTRTKSIFTDSPSEATPPKRPKMDLTATPKTPKCGSNATLSPALGRQLAQLLDMPLVQSPDLNLYERTGAETPHSILKTRRNEAMEASPVDSRYLDESDDELLETGSNYTHYSDSTNKHLRFTIPTASESGSTPSPPAAAAPAPEITHREDDDSHMTSTSHAMDETNPMESPPKKQATEEKVQSRKSYKDTVKSRRSLSISANSSLSDDPNTSIESIADIPITLINPRYSGEMRRRQERLTREREDSVIEMQVLQDTEMQVTQNTEMQVTQERASQDRELPKTPTSRRGIRTVSGESTPLINRSRSGTPERLDSPITPLRTTRITRSRSRSRTPEISPRAPLPPIPELAAQEACSEPHAPSSALSKPIRSRSRTPERVEKGVIESPRLEAITESPTKSSGSDSPASPSRRSLRSRSRTPEVEIAPEETKPASPRSLRSRTKTPEKIMSPKREQSARVKKPLSRLVLEHNTFAKLKNEEPVPEASESAIECTPMKTIKQVPSLMDVTLSPIVNKSVLQSSTDSVLSETIDKDATKPEDKSVAELGLKSLPAFTTIHETFFEKSVLHSYQSSIADSSQSIVEDKETNKPDETTNIHLKSLPAFTTLNDTEINKSVLHSYQSSIGEMSQSIQEEKETKITEASTSKFSKFTEIIETNFETSVLKSYQSSMAETSHEMSKDGAESSSRSLKDASLITNDSDVDMKEGNEWKSKIDSQETATVIQKEKEKIGDIEREINEIEGDMTDDDGEEADSSGDEEIVEASNSDVSDEDDSDETADSSDSDEEIISIQDTDDDSSSSENKLEIDEGTSTDADDYDTQKLLHVIAEDNTKENAHVPEETAKTEEVKDVDPLNQAQVSMLTDDNSVLESDQSVNLNYSDDKGIEESNVSREVPMESESTEQQLITDDNIATFKTDNVLATPVSDEKVVFDQNKLQEVPMDTESAVQVLIAVEQIIPVNTDNVVITAVPKDIDVVDSVPAENTEVVADAKPEADCAGTEPVAAVLPVESTISTTNSKDSAKTTTESEATEQQLITDDNIAPVKTDNVVETPVSDEKVVFDQNKPQEVPMDTESAVQVLIAVEQIIPVNTDNVVITAVPKDIDVVDSVPAENTEVVADAKPEADCAGTEPVAAVLPVESTISTTNIEDSAKTTTEVEKVSDKSTKMPVSSAEIKESVISITETQPSLTKKQSPQTTPVLENISDKSKDQEVTSQSNESDVEKESNKPAPRSRKRVKSTSSNKSVTETRTDISEEPKTPITRKRTQSNASNKSVTETEQKTPENIANEEIPTPSRRRAKTPTSAEVRKIMTRRASKEMSEKMDESKDTFDDSVTATPRRRSTRSKAKTIDDNESVTSESSVRSTRSKASEDAGDVKAAPIRKGRKSILSTKPDLSAIPEMITEEESKGTEELMNDYSSSRRLTRHQKAVLESWLEPTSSPSTRPKATRGRRPSAASRTSGVSDRDDDDVSSTHSSEIMDRISLLNKTEFEGSPDTEEYPYTGSPDSIASEASKQRRGRAASEAKSTPKAAKINRRVSVEIGETSLASPSGRRASFQKACSALHALTPSKSRRASTDTRKESVSPLAESPAGSEAEAPATPARRSRRLPSGAAGASQAKAETGKRTKKSSAQDEK